MKRATIRDVAEHAGVSRAAVSKVLRNAYGLSDDMRRRVEAAMLALNYRPQVLARGLRGRTYTLGIVLPDMHNPFFPEILDGVTSALRNTIYQPVIGLRPAVDATEGHLIETMLDHKIDGFILIAPRLEQKFVQDLARTVPVVVIGNHDQDCGYDTVNNDDRMGAALVVRHLVDLGHQRIAYFGLDPGHAGSTNATKLRHEGYTAEMTAHGLSGAILVVNSVHSRGGEDDHRQAGEILDASPRPTAVFAWTDSVAITLMGIALERGISVPDQLSVVGYDNTRLAAIPQISLSSVNQFGSALGEKATELLIERIEGRTEEVHFLLDPTIERRRSTAAAPSE